MRRSDHFRIPASWYAPCTTSASAAAHGRDSSAPSGDSSVGCAEWDSLPVGMTGAGDRLMVNIIAWHGEGFHTPTGRAWAGDW